VVCLVKDGGTAWTGVRNFQARNNLRAMKARRHRFCTNTAAAEKMVVGVARLPGTYRIRLRLKATGLPLTCAAQGRVETGELAQIKRTQS